MANNATIHTGPSSSNDMVLILHAVFDELGVTLQRSCRSCLLLAFTLWRIHIHEGQTDVRLGHQQRIGAVHMHAPCRQVGAHNVHGFTHGVAGSAQRPTMVPFGILDAQMFHKAPHRQWRTPSMHRKTKT